MDEMSYFMFVLEFHGTLSTIINHVYLDGMNPAPGL